MTMVTGRPIKIRGMAYAPTNEQGVVLLFGRLAPRLGFHVEGVQTAFPDCLARRQGKVWRIEFEYRASRYKGHPPRGADIIVCWDNDWDPPPPRYRHLEIMSLRRYVDAEPRVFAVGCNQEERGAYVDRRRRIEWSVPGTAQVGDLVVMYRTHPVSGIRDLWTVKGPIYDDPDWGVTAHLQVLSRLDRPVSYRALRTDRLTRNLSIVRRRFQGRSDITEDWPDLATVLIRQNPQIRKLLQSFNVD